MRKAKSTTIESASVFKRQEKAARKKVGESSKTFEEHEPMLEPEPLDVEVLRSDQAQDLSSLPPSQVADCVPTPDSCPNCSTLKKENRKPRNSVKILRGGSKKRKAEIRKLRKKGFLTF